METKYLTRCSFFDKDKYEEISFKNLFPIGKQNRLTIEQITCLFSLLEKGDSLNISIAIQGGGNHRLAIESVEEKQFFFSYCGAGIYEKNIDWEEANLLIKKIEFFIDPSFLESHGFSFDFI